MTVTALGIVFKARTSEYMFICKILYILYFPSDYIVTGQEREKQTFQTINYFCAIKDHSTAKEVGVKPNFRKIMY